MFVHVALAVAWFFVGGLTATTYFLAQRHLKPKDHPMPVDSRFTGIISSLTGSATSLSSVASTLVANPPGLPAGAMDAQDVTDTLAALQPESDGVATETAAVQSALTPPTS